MIAMRRWSIAIVVIVALVVIWAGLQLRRQAAIARLPTLPDLTAHSKAIGEHLRARDAAARADPTSAAAVGTSRDRCRAPAGCPRRAGTPRARAALRSPRPSTARCPADAGARRPTRSGCSPRPQRTPRQPRRSPDVSPAPRRDAAARSRASARSRAASAGAPPRSRTDTSPKRARWRMRCRNLRMSAP